MTGEQADCQTEYISERAVNGDIQDIFGRPSNNLISGQKFKQNLSILISVTRRSRSDVAVRVTDRSY